ncbi:hypothetical protein TNCV_3920651 [Trichonephila clavipes]|nr:hypothetical protein TNCV_3920651 [Trichonephila clavipes]
MRKTTQLVSRNETTQLNRRKQLNSAAGTNYSTRQQERNNSTLHCRRPLTTACNCLHRLYSRIGFFYLLPSKKTFIKKKMKSFGALMLFRQKLFCQLNNPKRKIEELTEILNVNKVHIACLQETKLNPNLKLKIKGFTTLRKDRPDNSDINLDLLNTLLDTKLDTKILLGDLNAKSPSRGSRTLDLKGSQIEDLLCDNDLSILKMTREVPTSPKPTAQHQPLTSRPLTTKQQVKRHGRF